MKNIQKVEMEGLLERGYTQKEMASAFSCSLPTVRRYLKLYNLKKYNRGEILDVQTSDKALTPEAALALADAFKEGTQEPAQCETKTAEELNDEFGMCSVPVTGEGLQDELNSQSEVPGMLMDVPEDMEILGMSKEKFALKLRLDCRIELPLKELLECTPEQLMAIYENYDKVVPDAEIEEARNEPDIEAVEKERQSVNMKKEWTEKGKKAPLVRAVRNKKRFLVKPKDPYTIMTHDIESISKVAGVIRIKIVNGPLWKWTKAELSGTHKQKKALPTENIIHDARLHPLEQAFENANAGFDEIVV